MRNPFFSFILWSSVCGVVSLPMMANAQQPAATATPSSTTTVTVESTRLDELSIEPSRSTFTLDEKAIEKRHANSVTDLLREIPGIEVVRQGGVGQTTSVFIRGARSEDTLVLIDGMEANDAMSPSAGFDFSSMLPENIQRIEVYLGPQSVRFGAGALGGVINIVTKKGLGQPQFGYLLEGGSYQSLRGALSSSGVSGPINYSVNAEGLSTKGFSAASENYGNTEADGAKIKAASAKIGWGELNGLHAEATARVMDSTADLDSGGGAGSDDPNFTAQSKQVVAGLTAADRFLNQKLGSTLGFYYSEVNRTDSNSADLLNPTISSDLFLSETRKIESNHELTLDDRNTIRVGAQWREESGIANSVFSGFASPIDRRTQSVTGLGLTYLYDSATWFADVGARDDASSKVGSIPSWRASIGRKINESGTKVYATYGTGFKLPSLYQLYSSYGSQDLREEKSRTIDVTVEQEITSIASAKASYFDNHYENMIDYNTATNTYYNLSKALSRGLQVELDLRPLEALLVRGFYTYLDAKDDSSGQRLLRRPLNAWIVDAQYVANDKYTVSAQYFYKGERDDIDPTAFTRRVNSAYGIVNLQGDVTLTRAFKVLGRIENLFNQNYEEVLGYGSPRLSFYAGLSGQF